MVNENELRIIEELSRESGLTQREISDKTRLSLGAVNIILKRLIKRGFLKTKTLNPKKMEYIVTPKGFSEKTKKSYAYFIKTVNLVRAVREEIAKIIQDENNKERKKFIILGNDDLADIIELALKGYDYKKVKNLKEIEDKNALLLLGEKKCDTNGFNSINLAKRLGEKYWGIDFYREELG